MMTKTEYLLWVVAEECAEVAQRASKCARFGVEETEPGKLRNNAARLMDEWADLIGVMTMLRAHLGLPAVDSEMVLAKVRRVEQYAEYSRELGILETTEKINADE